MSLLAATFEAGSLFLLLHMAAASGHCDARSLMLETTLSPAQTGQPVLPFFTAQTTFPIMALNSCPQSRHLKKAFRVLLTATSEAESLFLPLHMAAISGYFEARSLMPGTILFPAQTGQPVRLFITEWTTLQARVSNSCPQFGHTKVSFLLLPVVTSKASFLSFSLSIAAAFGQATARQFSLTALYGISMPRDGTGAQAAQLQVLTCITFTKVFIIILFSPRNIRGLQ